MCLAIPGQVITIDEKNETVMIDYHGLQKSAHLRLFPHVRIGDYVLVHAGFVIQVLDNDEGAALSELVGEISLDEY
jgi:hydrogenase expression/formation protein HypC